MPSFSEYFAYMFSFTGIMCGPFAFYNDVMPILRGSYKKVPYLIKDILHYLSDFFTA